MVVDSIFPRVMLKVALFDDVVIMVCFTDRHEIIVPTHVKNILFVINHCEDHINNLHLHNSFDFQSVG